jgi:hypothetical protein
MNPAGISSMGKFGDTILVFTFIPALTQSVNVLLYLIMFT